MGRLLIRHLAFDIRHSHHAQNCLFDRILLRVPSLPGMTTYCRDTLGPKAPSPKKGRAASFLLSEELRQSELVLHTTPDRPGEEIFYLVEDVRAIHRDREKLRLKFVTPPQRATRGYRATVRDPFGNVLQLIDRSGGAESPQIEDAKSCRRRSFPASKRVCR